MRWLAPLLLSALPALAGPSSDIARALRESAFDRGECYRVRDLTILRPGVRIYLTDGYLMFTKPVAGRRVAAVFTSDVEGGDAEVIVMPPTKGERRSLAFYIGSPTLNEHVRTAVFLSTGGLHAEILAQMSANPTNRKMLEMAPLLDERWAPVLRNLVASYETRLALDLISGAPPEDCLFGALFTGVKLGNLDVIVDPRAHERLVAGQVVTREGRVFFDTWTSFEPRNEPRRAPVLGTEVVLSGYRIEASVAAGLGMSIVTKVKVRPVVDGLKVVAMDIARNMTVDSATVDGAAAEVLQREALRANLRRAGNEMFLVTPAAPLRAGREYEFEFRHQGNVIHSAGDRVFYVSARANWYPSSGAQFAMYDLKFRYPRDLDMVGAGEVVEDKTEGEWRVTRRRTAAPVRLAGFNLGSYAHTRVSKGGYVVEVYANHSLEAALQAKLRPALVAPPQIPSRTRRSPAEQQIPMPAPDPSPTLRLQLLASEIADAMQFMASKFGAPALPFLTVSPIPGTFGQGFPGLIYLSTLSYLQDRGGARPLVPTSHDLFFGDILQAHETAHQWWGNVVTAAGYRDYWLMEALANYSALLYLEKRKGPRSMEQTLLGYRNDLMSKSESGLEVDSAGPIVLGTRLEMSAEPRAWRTITYGKGSWIVHMLRRIMGDERFLAMLGELRRQYERKELATEGFRAMAAKYLPPKFADPQLEAFFDHWVYGTGIPALKLSYSVKGKAPLLKVVGTVTQSEVNADSSVLVPVEIQFARAKPVVYWVLTSGEPASFEIAVRQQPGKVLLDPHGSVLRR